MTMGNSDDENEEIRLTENNEQGTLYDIEMQTTDYATPDELPKRTRYYQAMMDMDVLNKGELYTKLRRTYIIFICTFDPFDRGRSLYTFSPQGKFTESIADAVEAAKENKEMKVEYMTFFMELRRREEKGREEGRAEGLAEGEAKGTIKGKAEGRWTTLVELVHDGLLTVKEAAKRAGMTEEAFRKLVTR